MAELGRALDLMVGRREGQRDHEAAQAEFADTMQRSETEPDCPLATSLQGAKPRSCLAVRFGRVHQGGLEREPLLASLAAAMRSSLRESDFVGRYGGEEFLILLPDTGKQQAKLVAEKVRAAVETIYVASLDQKVTASLGVASLPEDCGDADTLIRAADRALSSAKGRGRNRVELFESGQGPATAPAPAGPGPS